MKSEEFYRICCRTCFGGAMAVGDGYSYEVWKSRATVWKCSDGVWKCMLNPSTTRPNKNGEW